MSATYEEVIVVWKKVAKGATVGYTCYVSRKTVLKRLSDLYEMLKKAEDPKAATKHHDKWLMYTDKLFDISKDDIKQHLCAEDYNFIQDQKGPRRATFGRKDTKLVKKLKCQLSREELLEKKSIPIRTGAFTSSNGNVFTTPFLC